jgi:AcrR family transcriptional regulator
LTSFAEFRDTYEYRGDKIYELIYERHKYSLRGKRPEVVVRNLKAIFEHAFEISQQRGFYAMSLRDLSRSSELSIGALYGCIKSKNDIPNIVCDTINFVHTGFLQSYQNQPASVDVLTALIRQSVYIAEIWDSWFRFLFREKQHLDDESRRCILTLDESHLRLVAILISDQLGKRVGQSVNEPVNRSDEFVDQAMIPRAVISFVNEWSLKNSEYKSQGVTVDRYATALVELTLRLLR